MRKVVIPLFAALIMILFPVNAFAANTRSTSYTVTLTINRKEEVSQDAYLPAGMYLDLGLSGAQDLFVAGNRMYIADTGNKRILVVDLQKNTVAAVGEGVLNAPRGVAADAEGRIYVADPGNSLAYRFTADGRLDFTFEKPTTPNFGEDEKYKPVKISPADGGGAYIISEGAQAGVVYLSGAGDFLGYFASNDVTKSLFDGLLDLVLTEQQKNQFLSITPPSFENIFRGSDGLVYTINKGSTATIKKHSINGLNMLANNKNMPELSSLSDLCVTGDGRMIAIDSKGFITEMSFDGYLLCKFGGSAGNSAKIGLFSVPTGIGADSEGNIYVLDADRNYVQVFTATTVQQKIQGAIDLYNDGQYDRSIAILEEVLKYNNSSYFAHLYLGLNYMQKAEYRIAEAHFRTANARENYSDAYWESRNLWLQENMVYILSAVLAFVAVYQVLRILQRRRKIFSGLAEAHANLKKNRLYHDLTRIPHAFLHPIDNAYDIRKLDTGTYASANVLYLMLFAVLILYQTSTGFIFASSAAEFSLFNNAVLFTAAFGLFIVSNYFISSINDGEGTFRSIYIAVAYSFSPVILIMPFMIVFANFATIDESYLIWTIIGLALFLSAVNIVLSIIEIHQYTFRQTIGNILVTLFFMAVIIFAGSIVYLLAKQIVDFVRDIIVEVSLRG